MLRRLKSATIKVMKKVIIYAVFLLSFVVFPVTFVFAAGVSQSTGLLPSNPFYFVKEWTRSVKRAWIFDTIKKVEFDLNIVNEKAAELQKLSQIASDKEDLITDALTNYKLNLEQLIPEVEKLKGLNIADINKLLDRLVERSLAHAELFSALSSQFNENNDLSIKLKDVEKRVLYIMVIIPQKVEKPEDFRIRLQQIINNQDQEFKELKAAEILDYLEALLPAGAMRNEINKLKKDLLLKFGVQAQNGLNQESFSQLTMDPMIKLKLLDEIRKTVNDQDLKNKLNLLRQRVLDQVAQSGKIGQSEAREALEQATQSLSALQSKVRSSQALDQAKFYLTQAQNFYNQINYVSAFSQAVSSIGVSDEALRKLASDLAFSE